MPTKKTAAKATPAKKAAVKKATAKKATAKKTTTKKAAAKKAVVEKAAAKKAAPKKVAAKKAAAKKTVAAAPTTPPTTPPPPVLAPPDTGPTVMAIDAPRPRAEGVATSFEGPQARQRRVTVAFRVILALPHILFSALLSRVALVVVVIAWFAALFTGRVPLGIATFVARVIQYGARVSSYSSLLFTDKYPTFSLDAPDGPVTIQVGTTRLNRAAVFFRLILLVPAALLYAAAAAGMALASFFIWLVVLVKGRLPQTIFEAEAAILRYRIRLQAYGMLLTATYPGGLFGDRADDEPAPSTVLPAEPRITRVLLSKAARRLVGLLLVLGTISLAGLFTVAIITAAQSTETERRLEASHDDLLDEVRIAFTAKQSCAFEGGVDCLHSNDTRLARAFEEFSDDVVALEYFDEETDEVDALLDDIHRIIVALENMATLRTPDEYNAATAQLSQLIDEFDQDYEDLIFEVSL